MGAGGALLCVGSSCVAAGSFLKVVKGSFRVAGVVSGRPEVEGGPGGGPGLRHPADLCRCSGICNMQER